MAIIPFSTLQTQHRLSIVHQVRVWGEFTSDAVLDPANEIFMRPHLEGLIGYRVEKKCAVVFGDPICPSSSREMLVHAFHSYCKAHHWKILYLITSQEFKQWSLQQQLCKGAIEMGSEMCLDNPHDARENQGDHASLIRRKTKQAIREGVVIQESLSSDSQLEHSLEELGKIWLRDRHRPQIYMSHIRLFEDREGKRWFYAQRGETIVAMAVLNKIEKEQGWFLNRLMALPQAPHGTTEWMIVSILQTLSQEQCPFISFGFVPSSRLGEMSGLKPFSHWTAPLLFKMAKGLFKLDRHRTFWEKFDCQTRPSYLLTEDGDLGLKETWAVMRALNVNWI